MNVTPDQARVGKSIAWASDNRLEVGQATSQISHHSVGLAKTWTIIAIIEIISVQP